MIPERRELELGKWYEHGNLAFKFEGMGRGSGAFVRGRTEDLVSFIRELNEAYSLPFRAAKNYEILNAVLQSGKGNLDWSGIIYFSDDRIRRIVRCDDQSYVKDGQYSGNAGYLELLHHEQYGGNYKGDPVINSNTMMMSRVLTALGNTAGLSSEAHIDSKQTAQLQNSSTPFGPKANPAQPS